jgi:hypothetical protein
MIARADKLLVAAILLAGPIAVWRWQQGIPRLGAQPAQVDRVLYLPEPYDEDSLDLAFERLVHGDPFRLSRQPSEIPYSAEALAAPAAAPKFAPALVLRGIVGGPPWQAVIDGIPDLPAGTVVTSGSTFGQLTIRLVTRDSVFVQTPDTAWYLTLVKGNE